MVWAIFSVSRGGGDPGSRCHPHGWQGLRLQAGHWRGGGRPGALTPSVLWERPEPGSGTWDGFVYALGGMGADTSPQALARVYDPVTTRWQLLPSMPTPCYGASAFLQGNKIFLLGGRQGKLPVTAFEGFDLETRSWTRYPSVPSRRAFAGCAVADGCFFSLGGLQQPGPHNFYSRPHFVNTVEMFDPEQGAWSKQGRAVRMREKRADFVAGCLGGRVVVAGGLGNQSFPLGSVEGFSISRKKWELLPPMPTGRCSCSSYQAPSLLFVIGGVAQGPSGAVEALCLREGA
ncbi:kelch domain-containing protein 8B isoform X2 [Gopherus evgoodei]|uniref:kelch domain-containing protein 8B isoform X2 n=1 Tax=Gopherus evgoodei TaxID=1825980 RepID=UPI0011D0321E|nr:kelch domain-containing protein 8B isoform X2 [Gopherus evgoodei]